MALIDSLLADLAYVSLTLVALQLLMYSAVAVVLSRKPEINLIWLCALFLAYNLTLLAYTVLLLTQEQSQPYIEVSLNTVSNCLYAICHWKFSWQYFKSAKSLEVSLMADFDHKPGCLRAVDWSMTLAMVTGFATAGTLALIGIEEQEVNGGF